MAISVPGDTSRTSFTQWEIQLNGILVCFAFLKNTTLLSPYLHPVDLIFKIQTSQQSPSNAERNFTVSQFVLALHVSKTEQELSRIHSNVNVFSRFSGMLTMIVMNCQHHCCCPWPKKLVLHCNCKAWQSEQASLANICFTSTETSKSLQEVVHSFLHHPQPPPPYSHLPPQSFTF